MRGGIGLLLVAAVCGKEPAPPMPPSVIVQPAPAVVPSEVDRYRLVTETLPTTFRGSPVLLDTATGESWIACDVGKVTSWCDMPRGNVQTGTQRAAR